MTERRDTRRRLDQFIANPNCNANVLSAAAGVPMEQVAQLVGLEAPPEPSPFALLRGVRFEWRLFENRAERLRAALVRAGVLAPGPNPLCDLRLRERGGPLPDLEAARRGFEALLLRIARADSTQRLQLPRIVAAPAMRLPGLTHFADGRFAIDVLTVHIRPAPEPVVLQVGEIKVYPDRGGHTDSQELATTRAQAGLYVFVLRKLVRALKIARAISVASEGFLVLTQPGSGFPSVRAHEDFRWQAERAARAFARLRQATPPQPADPNGPDWPKQLDAVRDAPKSYGERCLGFCALAGHCHQQALDRGDPAVLGPEVARFLGGLSLFRAEALLHGDVPQNPAETDFLRRIAEAPRMGAE